MEIELWMVFEAVAATEEGVEDSLDEHLEKLRSEENLKVTESNIDEVSKVENPHPDLEEGFSQVAECRVEVATFQKAVKITFTYGPTYVQMEGPDTYEMSLKDGQESLQEVANTIHQYAQKGVGGVLVSRAKEQ